MTVLNPYARAKELFENPGITGSDDRLYVKGPCSGMGYDSGTLYRDMRLSSTEDVDAAVKLCQQAYILGVEEARREMRKALGL